MGAQGRSLTSQVASPGGSCTILLGGVWFVLDQETKLRIIHGGRVKVKGGVELENFSRSKRDEK